MSDTILFDADPTVVAAAVAVSNSNHDSDGLVTLSHVKEEESHAATFDTGSPEAADDGSHIDLAIITNGLTKAVFDGGVATIESTDEKKKVRAPKTAHSVPTSRLAVCKDPIGQKELGTIVDEEKKLRVSNVRNTSNLPWPPPSCLFHLQLVFKVVANLSVRLLSSDIAIDRPPVTTRATLQLDAEVCECMDRASEIVSEQSRSPMSLEY
jgi:hypothetical protein